MESLVRVSGEEERGDAGDWGRAFAAMIRRDVLGLDLGERTAISGGIR